MDAGAGGHGSPGDLDPAPAGEEGADPGRATGDPSGGGPGAAAAVEAVAVVERARRVYWERCMSGLCQQLGDLDGAAYHALEARHRALITKNLSHYPDVKPNSQVPAAGGVDGAAYHALEAMF